VKENDTRGSEPHFVKRKLYLKSIKVACKHIKGPEDIDKEKKKERKKKKKERRKKKKKNVILDVIWLL